MNDNLQNAIKEVSSVFPHMRFGQILDNVILATGERVDLFYLTDDELAAKIREYQKVWEAPSFSA